MRGDRHRKDRGEPRFFGQGYQGAHSDAGREARDAHGCHCRGMDWAKTGACAARHSRVWTLREHSWSTRERIALIATLAIVMGALFVTTYSLALGDPVPHRIDAAVVGDPDAHPLGVHDPSGMDIFYLMLVATIVGFITVFQIGAQVSEMSLRHWTEFIIGLALAASLVFVLVDGPLLHRLDLPIVETWGILALQLLAVASFARLMTVLVGRWSILPTWLFFVVLGNSASGGAVSPPLLPPPFAFVSQWLPSGATVTSLRDAIYFPGYQHARPIVVLMAWAAGLFVVMLAVAQRRRVSPGG